MQLKIPLVFIARRTHCWLRFNLVSSRASSPLSAKLLQLGNPQHTLVRGVVLPQVQDLAFPLVEFHEVLVRPFLQPVKIPQPATYTEHWGLEESQQNTLASTLGSVYDML